MNNLQMTIVLAGFFGLLGACVGSFLNVVVWRLPHRGREVKFGGKTGPLTLSWPPSHCPSCDAPVAWFQNVPVLSWAMLRGRCARCHVPLAIRYPLVELGTGVIFAGLFLAYFVGSWPRPGWFVLGPDTGLSSWAALVLQLFLIGSLLAASAIDADWYIIPLGIPALLAAVGIVGAPFIAHPVMPGIDSQGPWALPTIGAAVGLVVANVLLALKWIPQSFDDADQDRDGKGEGQDQRRDSKGGAVEKTAEPPITPLPVLSKKWPSIVATIVLLLAVGGMWMWVAQAGAKHAAVAAVVTLGAGIVLFLIGVLPRDAGSVDVTSEVMEEIAVPRARWEISKELLFVALPVFGAVIAAMFPIQLPAADWLGRLLGAMLGFLAGGGVVWFVRIGGTLGFGKEAMGLGDVHLMAAVGAVLGAPLVVLAFFLAPFLGLLWAGVLACMRKQNVLPYGPWLSVASIVVMVVGHRVLERILGGM